jgi:hypothetical protein
MDRDEAERLYYEYFETIGEIVAFVSRNLSTLDAEEFDICVKEKLCSDEFRRIRGFEGRNRASFRTFLTAVINNLFKDFLDHIWGKFRPTEGAKRRGKDAVLLERLLREKYSFEEAFEIMRTDNGLMISRNDFEELARHVNPRLRLRVEAGNLPETTVSEENPEDLAILRQMLERYCALLRQLQQTCQDLDVEDALIVKFRFHDGRTTAEIEDLLGVKRSRRPGKSAARRLERLTNDLRASLESAGFSAADVKAFLANPGLGGGCDESATVGAHS